MEVTIHDSRKQRLQAEFNKPYFTVIKDKLLEERQKYTVYPPAKLIFNAFDTTHFDNVKVVILGQDPYHGSGQAMGLSFSVPQGIALPPSLQNIYKELYSDLDLPMAQSGDLTLRAQQGVLLLNAILTVRANTAGSHQQIGRQEFTDAVIRLISEHKKHVVFLLRGKFAQSKKVLIDTNKHLVLEAPHPSPFSVHTGFFGCRHFSKTNEYLRAHGIKEIEWRIL